MVQHIVFSFLLSLLGVTSVGGSTFSRRLASDYDLVCNDLSSVYRNCLCTASGSQAVGVMSTSAFVTCIGFEDWIVVNFTGPERYLSSLYTCDRLNQTCTSLVYNESGNITTCQTTFNNRACGCDVCEDGLQVDCTDAGGDITACTSVGDVVPLEYQRPSESPSSQGFLACQHTLGSWMIGLSTLLLVAGLFV